MPKALHTASSRRGSIARGVRALWSRSGRVSAPRWFRAYRKRNHRELASSSSFPLNANLAERLTAALQKGALDRVLAAGQCRLVRLPRFGVAAQASQQVGADGVEQV